MRTIIKTYTAATLLTLLTLCFCRALHIDEKYVAKLARDKLSIVGSVTAQKSQIRFSGAQIFTVISDSKKYVVRFLTHKSHEKQKQEIATAQIASMAGYGPQVYFADVEKAVVIMEFLPRQDISPQQRYSDSLYVLLAQLLQKIHRGPKFETMQEWNVFDAMQKKIENLKLRCSEAIPLKKLENITADIHRAIAPHVTIAPCHHDLNPDNLIFLGDKFKAIDYEFAAQGEPYFDIAAIANFYCLNPTFENILLSTYLERQPMGKETAKLYLMKQSVWIFYALIFLAMVPELLPQYGNIPAPSYADFMKGLGDLEKPEIKLQYAKVLINHVFANVESQEFSDAITLLKKS